MTAKNKPYSTRLAEFNTRWNIEGSDPLDFGAFRNRFINLGRGAFHSKTMKDLDVEDMFRSINGLQPNTKSILERIVDTDDVLDKISFIGRHLTQYSPLAGFDHRFMKAVQSVFWILDELKPENWQGTKDQLLKGLEQAILLTPNLNLAVVNQNGEVLLMPAGAEELDTTLINENLIWLENYPEVRKCMNKALSLYSERDEKTHREVLDNLRKSIELLAQSVLGNKRNIENNLTSISSWLELNGVNKEIRNMYVVLLDYFIKYQNERVKHGDSFKSQEIEFLIYQTGVFIRLVHTTMQQKSVPSIKE